MFSSQLDPVQRVEALESLANEEFDILIIGGGVNGAGAALDAASRGLRVALVESQDIAAGTSSRSSKLIHGGLRYLEQYDFKLVREALQERELMVSTQAPHLVKPVAFLFPLHEKVRERTYIGAGLALYDALRGFKRALPWHKHISQKSIAEIAPSLRPDVVTGAIKYYDAQVDDARHTLTIARTAARHGAVITTRTRVESLVRDGKRVVGAYVKDLHSGKLIKVSAKATVMCAGIWSDELHESFEITPGYNVQMSKGVHITVPGNAIRSQSGIILKTSVSVLFIIPWEDKWIIGTTDTPYTGDRANPVADRADVEYILEQANRVLDPVIRPEHVIGVFAGLRPLVADAKASATTKISREHICDRPVPGFVSVAGGKYTTYRVMAKDVIDLAATELRRLTPKSTTEKIPLVGADGYYGYIQQKAIIAERYGVGVETVEHLLNRYGSLTTEVLDLLDDDPTLSALLDPDLPYIRAEIYYAASHEGAMSVDDVLTRRTRIAFELDDQGVSVAAEVASIIAPILGWSAKERKDSVSEYEEKVDKEIAAVDQLLEESINS